MDRSLTILLETPESMLGTIDCWELAVVWSTSHKAPKGSRQNLLGRDVILTMSYDLLISHVYDMHECVP